jgi:hypothetical protein
MRRCVFVVLAVFLFASRASAQDSLRITDGFSEKNGFSARKAIATGVVGSIFLGTAVDAYFTWWKDAEKPFSFYTEDWFKGPHLGLDKVGHHFGTFVLFKITRNLLLWGGYERSTALWWAAGLSFLNGLEIEVGDGFSIYGFDYQDLLFDVTGVAYGILQTEIPFLNNFDFKFSYYSKGGFKSPVAFTEDYDAMTIWLSMNVHRLLPSSVRNYWPEFINIAVGYSVDDHQTRREFAIGLDLNLEAFKTSNEDILLGERILNVMRLPLPAANFIQGKPADVQAFYLR